MNVFLLDRASGRPLAIPYAEIQAHVSLPCAARARVDRAAPFPPPGLSSSSSNADARFGADGTATTSRPSRPVTPAAAAPQTQLSASGAGAGYPSITERPPARTGAHERGEGAVPQSQAPSAQASSTDGIDADFESRFVALPASRVGPRRRRGPYLRPLSKDAEGSGPGSQFG